MTNSSTERQEELATWLRRLTQTLHLQGGDTWKALVQIVSGKTATITLDGITLQVTGKGGDNLQLDFEYVPSVSINFSSDGDTLRDIVAGKLTVDNALINGRIYARKNLDELLGIYELVMRILADSATNYHLQELWMEFDKSWFGYGKVSSPLFLSGQKPSYGYLMENIPQDVLEIEVQPDGTDY